MKIDTDNIVSLSEANRNFSRVARLADEVGTVMILRNNAPSYLLIEFSQAEKEQLAVGEDVAEIARRIVDKSMKELGIVNTKLRTDQKTVAGIRDTEQKIREVNATMAMEGMPLTEADMENMRAVLRGDVSFAEMKQRILDDYQPKRSACEQV